MKMRAKENLKKILQDFQNACEIQDIALCPKFAEFFIHLLVRDARLGLNLIDLTACKTNTFLSNAIEMYVDPLEPTACSMKLAFLFEHFPNRELAQSTEQYTQRSNETMKMLMDGILQYPENSNDDQLEEMLMKIQVFIVAKYCIGSPKNHVLLKQTRQSLNSVIGRGDLKMYVLKMKPHRLEYLERLAATVCGILIYNNHGPSGDKENMHDILANLQKAKTNTKVSIDDALKHCVKYKKIGFNAIMEIIQLDVGQKMAHCQLPVEKVITINKFIALFNVYEHLLHQLNEIFEKTRYLIETEENKMKCVIYKIDDVLRCRTAIDSELVFPHFVYLSEIWTSLVLYFNHLAEINKLKSAMDDIVTPELKKKFTELVEAIETAASVRLQYAIEPTFDQLVARAMRRTGRGSLLKIGESITNFCSLTIALSGGLLVPSSVHKKLCEDLNLKFGFANMEFAKYAERNFEEFIGTLQNVVFSSVDLLLVFDLYKNILEEDFNEDFVNKLPNTKSLTTQTELMIESDTSISNRLKTSWNIWDFHRETVHLANLRKCQTHSTQTFVCYGRRNAQNATYKHKRSV